MVYYDQKRTKAPDTRFNGPDFPAGKPFTETNEADHGK